MSRKPRKHFENTGWELSHGRAVPLCECLAWTSKNRITTDPNDPDLCGNCKRILKAREKNQ